MAGCGKFIHRPLSERRRFKCCVPLGKLLGEKSKQIKFPIALMGADAVLSIGFIYCSLYDSHSAFKQHAYGR